MTILQHSPALLLSADGVLSACRARLVRTRRAGRLTVAAGRAWVTRQGDLDDHVLAAGQQLALGADERVVIEPWDGRSAVRLAWSGDQRAGVLRALERLAAGARRLRAALLGATAAILDALGVRALAWARTAQARAKRAQGSIAGAESSASSGALQ
jgi:hypothetical protein